MRKIRLNVAVVTITVSLIIIILGALGVLSFVSQGTGAAAGPGLGFFYNTAVDIHDGWQRLTGADQVSQELELQRAKVAILQEQAVELKDLQLENERLRGLAQYQDSIDVPAVSAQVIGRQQTGSRELLIINQGAKADITVGDLVLNEAGQLLGDIIEADERVSLVQSLTDSSFTTGARQPGTTIIGKVTGDLALGLRLSLIPLGAKLGLGEILVTTAKPQALIGTIEQIGAVPGNLFQEGIMRPLADPSAALFVSVIISQP